MSKQNPTLEDLRTFALTARLGSFTRVAEQMHTSPSSISIAIGRLEAQLGARLFQRTTRKIVLTDEGKELLGRSERLLDDVEELTGLFRQRDNQLRGRLRVDMPLGMASGIVMEMLPTFARLHPLLTIDALSSDRRVDVVADGYDCVVRAGPPVDEALVCRPLGNVPLVNVASRSYLDVHGEPRDLADLAAHYLVNYQPNPSDAPAGFEYVHDNTAQLLAMRHRITVNNSAAYGAACRAGFGIAQLPLIGVQTALASGSLVEVMPDYLPPPMQVNLLYPHRRNVPQRVRLFGDWLAEVVQNGMRPSPR
jgi:DNA-binding transcriptional LysR family regulator